MSAIDATVFKYRGGQAPDALVWLTWEQGSAEVSNVVPCEAGSLTYDEYNEIAERFTQEALRPTLDGVQLQIELGPRERGIEDLVSPGTAAAIRDFSSSANRATGASHPMDAERWRHFVIRAHLDGTSLEADALQRWLHEDEGWDEDQALRLAIQYEQARDLLSQYDVDRERD